MKKLSSLKVYTCILLLTCCGIASAETPKQLAKAAYHQIEGNVFNRNEINSAILKLNQAAKLDQNEPWVYLTASLVHLVYGYNIGDWYEMKTFKQGSVDKALNFAVKASELGPAESQAYAHLARLNIVKRDYENARTLIERAMEINSTDFYPWYFKGILAEKQKDTANAKKYFEQALKYSAFAYQKGITNGHQQKVAAIEKNYIAEERLLKENISADPTDAILYGNYASFLMERKRYKEAVKYWELAVEKGPYKHAQTQLKEATRLATEQNE